ncbi:MAG: hypothetical protein KKB51_20935 [Candidatus Riflebacteria bacterium]|nr:hypothetical protein [Candidatus Riflebacteria bacterium]
MKHSARKELLLLAVFLLFTGSGFTAAANNQTYFNPLAIPELRPPPEQPETAVDTGITTAGDPRFGSETNPHRELFIPASEMRPPAPAMSIPVLDRLQPNRYDLNEWEEDRIFSSNLYTDSSYYATRGNGDRQLSARDQGEFYETNYRYELFSTRQNGDSLAVSLDTTYTNDRRPYRHGFSVNQATVDSRTRRSRLVLGHSFPEMSEFSMTQSVLGFYGVQQFDYTNVSGFTGYYANEREDLDNPRYIAGFRLEHARDDSLKIGFNVVGTEDGRDNAAASDELPSMTNRVYSVDLNMKPTENIFVNAEIAQSDTNYDKRDGPGEQTGDAYRFKTGYERENYNIEAGFEQGDTSFISPLGMTPRDESAYFARLYYELNRYISTRLSQRVARDNLANYQRSTIYREQPELQLTLRPSEYYKDMRIDIYYKPLHEYSEQKGFMDRYRDLLWLELNQRAGQFLYYAGLTQTIDKDDINVLNDRDIQRYDLNLTWEYDKLKKVYTSYSMEKLSYKRAGGMDQTSWIGFGGSSRFHENFLLSLDYLHETVDPTTVSSTHDRLNLSLTREYSATARLIIDLEGNRSSYSNNNAECDDYTARLRYLKAF